MLTRGRDPVASVVTLADGAYAFGRPITHIEELPMNEIAANDWLITLYDNGFAVWQSGFVLITGRH